MEEIGIEAIRAAVDAGRDVVKRTPVVPSVTLSEMLGSEMLGGNVVLKAENLQRTGAFKIRGAMNKLASLGDAVTRGVTAGPPAAGAAGWSYSTSACCCRCCSWRRRCACSGRCCRATTTPAPS